MDLTLGTIGERRIKWTRCDIMRVNSQKKMIAVSSVEVRTNISIKVGRLVDAFH